MLPTAPFSPAPPDAGPPVGGPPVDDDRLRLIDLERLRLEGQAADLRRAAATLRHHAVALPLVLRRLDAYDRPDVWQGALAERHRREVLDVSRRLASPSVGAGPALVEVAAHLDARAAQLVDHAAQLARSVTPAPPFGGQVTPWWQDPRFGPPS